MPLDSAEGRWMDGKSAADYAARCTVQGEELVVSSRDGTQFLARWPVRNVHVDAMHEGGVVHLEWAGAPGALLSVDDSLFVKTLRASGAVVKDVAVGRRGLVLGLACFAAFAALMGGFYASAPWVSARIAERIPLSAERKMAGGMAAFFANKTCSTPQANEAVRKMLTRLHPEGGLDVDVRVANLGMANAFALPGGTVLLTRGLLEEADGPDEVAGVLAHELGHVEHRHALSHMVRNALLGGLWAATLGDYSGMMVVDPKTAYDTATLKYSREAEAEADATGLRMLSDHGISAQGLVNFFERNSKGESTDTAWLSSHPASQARIAALSHQVLREKGPPVLDAEAFYHLRNACESMPRLGSLRDLFF